MMNTGWEILSVGSKERYSELFSRQLCIWTYHAPVNYEGTWDPKTNPSRETKEGIGVSIFQSPVRA